MVSFAGATSAAVAGAGVVQQDGVGPGRSIQGGWTTLKKTPHSVTVDTDCILAIEVKRVGKPTGLDNLGELVPPLATPAYSCGDRRPVPPSPELDPIWNSHLPISGKLKANSLFNRH